MSEHTVGNTKISLNKIMNESGTGQQAPLVAFFVIYEDN
jgi:hypothetical protein